MQGAVVQLTSGVPYQAKAAVEDQSLPRHYTNAPFWFVHYHAGWSYDLEHGFLPELSEIQQKPGVNGIGDDLKPNRAIAGSMAKGGVVIQHDQPNLGPWLNYLDRYPCRGGGFHYCFKGSQYHLLPNGGAAPQNTADTFIAFRVYLRDQGLVRTLSWPVYTQMREREGLRLTRLVKAAAKAPYMEEQVTAQRARIKAMETAWATANATPVAAPPGATKPVRGESVSLKADPS